MISYADRIGDRGVVVAGVATISLIASVFVGVSTVALAIAALVVRDFYVPWRKPDAATEFRTTRLLSIVIGFIPLVFVFFAPGLLYLSFFTRALRLSIAIVAIIAFYLPMFGSNRAATWGLIGAAVATSAWYFMGDPYGIDNMYIALITPAIVMGVERAFRGSGPARPAHGAAG